jgi:hypothetical protein
MRTILLCGVAFLAGCAGADISGCAQNGVFADPSAKTCLGPAKVSRAGKESRAGLKSLAEYCTAEGGFAAGARGEAYAGVCDGEAADAFLAAYVRGQKLYALERDARAAAQAASDASKDLWQVKRLIMEAEARRLSSMTPRAERNELNIALRAMHEERETLQAEVDRLSRLKERADQALVDFRATMALAAEEADRGAQATEARAASFP